MYIHTSNLNLTVGFMTRFFGIVDWPVGDWNYRGPRQRYDQKPCDNLTSQLPGTFLSFEDFNPFTTFSDGCLGSGNDEGRSKMR